METALNLANALLELISTHEDLIAYERKGGTTLRYEQAFEDAAIMYELAVVESVKAFEEADED